MLDVLPGRPPVSPRPDTAPAGRSWQTGLHRLRGAIRRLPLPVLLALLAAVVFARQPGRLLDASLWGEDGWVWFPQAYSHGWASLSWPHTAYLQTFSRLVACIALAIPLPAVPAFFAAAAFAVQLAVAGFLVSERMAQAWPDRFQRILFAFGYVLLPNAYETFVNLTNAQWHLAILAFLILFAGRPRSWVGWTFDAVVLGIASVSGPFSLFLAPIALWQAHAARSPSSILRAAIILAGAAVQAGLVITGFAAERPDAALGASPGGFVRIMALQLILPSGIGLLNGLGGIGAGGAATTALAAVLSAAAAVLALRALRHPSRMVRMFILFAGALLCAGLISPVGAAGRPPWPQMAEQSGAFNRYFLLPTLAWLLVLAVGLGDCRRPVRIAAAAALLLFACVAVPRDFHVPHWPLPEFRRLAEDFAAAPSGTRLAFPVAPDPAQPMVLTRR